MKKRTFTRVAVFGSVAALGLAGCGGQAATSSSGGAANQPAAGQAQGQRPDLSELAKTLGVSETKLQKAMEATRPTDGSQPSSDPSAALAKELGLDADKVREAMQDFMPQGGPPLGRRRAAVGRWPAAAVVLLVRGRRAVVTEHVFWIVSRAAGIVALLASSMSVLARPADGRAAPAGARPAHLARGARPGHHGRAGRPRGRSALRFVRLAERLGPARAVRRLLPAPVDLARDRVRLGDADPRPLLLRARAHRRRALAAAAPLDGARLAALARPRDRRGDRLRPGLVPRRDRPRRGPRRRPS